MLLETIANNLAGIENLPNKHEFFESSEQNIENVSCMFLTAYNKKELQEQGET